MKQNQKLLIAIGLGVLILVNVFVLGWVITDFFSGSNEPEKTVATTDDWENTTDAEPTEEPTEFIVEDNIVCILDAVNNRIICCDIEFDGVNYPAVSNVKGLYYNKNGQYALINDNNELPVLQVWLPVRHIQQEIRAMM